VSNLLTIDRLLCTGCAACVDVCPSGALRMDGEPVPTLVSALCDECLACLEACSTGAIQRLTSPQPVPVVAGEVVEGEIVEGEALPAPAYSRPLAPQPSRLRTGLAGSALAWVGSWLLPRAADALLDAVGRRLAGGASSAPHSRDESPMKPAGRHRRQRRRRSR
jgi:NAD-dependent dihydropyrimidine dehydrogenase PreA subunit